jgi:DNA-binding IclR family transcriptional regulator
LWDRLHYEETTQRKKETALQNTAAQSVEGLDWNLRLGIGSRLPIAATAIGRGYLAGAPAAARAPLEVRLHALDPANWPRNQESIRQAVADLAEHGCVRSFGEWRLEINAIAVPISLSPGLPLMVINVAAAAQSIFPEAFMRDIRPQLLATANAISSSYRRVASASAPGGDQFPMFRIDPCFAPAVPQLGCLRSQT